MTFTQFHNALRILLSIDRHELPGLTGEEWHAFRTDPFRWFIRASDERAAMIWRVIEKRQPQRQHEICPACGAVGHGNATCRACISEWPRHGMPQEIVDRLLAAIGDQAPVPPL